MSWRYMGSGTSPATKTPCIGVRSEPFSVRMYPFISVGNHLLNRLIFGVCPIAKKKSSIAILPMVEKNTKLPSSERRRVRVRLKPT